MVPFRSRSLFRSRWIALLWAAGICWTAVEVAGWNAGDDRPAADAGNLAANGAANSSDADLATLQRQVQAFESGR